jgi:hypothetical protein
MYWILDGRSEADAHKIRAQLEVPPPGYRGSLRGTSWDDSAMLRDFE